MRNTNSYKDIRFARARSSVLLKTVTVVTGPTIVAVIWQLLPPNTVFWCLLGIVGVLTWIASFGWRQAIVSVHNLLYRLEEL